MSRSHFKVLCILPLLALAMCKKDETPDPDPVPEVRVLDTALVFSVDSCCVLIPNIFTPNGDGMNDLLVIAASNVDTFHIEMRNAAGENVFVNANPLFFWDGRDFAGTITTGFYEYTFYCRSTSGMELTKINRIFLCKAPATDCFSASVPPQTNDMMDFAQCGFSFVSGEAFCYQ